MKRIILSILIILATTFSQASAIEIINQTDDYTADAAVLTSWGNFYGMILATDGTNPVTINIYDNASAASGDKLIPQTVITTSSTERATAISFNPPLRFNNGIYVDITTSGAVTYKIYHNKTY